MRDFEVTPETMLGYERSRTPFSPGQGLALDDSYRLAHLPLVAPGHPRIIPGVDGKDYRMGRHGERFSLVLPVGAEALEAAPAYRELVADLRRQGLARKIAWETAALRRERLHATICGGMAEAFGEEGRAALRSFGPFGVELRGLFSGNVNLGRLYLKLYPEFRAGRNQIQALQAALGRSESDLYVVGLFNLTDDLDAGEATELATLVQRWWDRPLLRFVARELWLLGSNDDLVLEGRVVERIALG